MSSWAAILAAARKEPIEPDGLRQLVAACWPGGHVTGTRRLGGGLGSVADLIEVRTAVATVNRRLSSMSGRSSRSRARCRGSASLEQALQGHCRGRSCAERPTGAHPTR